MIGAFTPDELARQLVELTSRVAATRREHLRDLLPSLEQLASTIALERGLDAQALEIAKAKYRSEFGLFARAFGGEARAVRDAEVAPIKHEVAADEKLEKMCLELLELTRASAADVEIRTNYHGGIFGAYDQATGQTEWREKWHHGVAGVWNPTLGAIEWREKWHHGVAGVWNPVAQNVEWRESWHGGIAGVWHPVQQRVEWRESYKSGVAGVWNPTTREIEWRESYKAGIAGYVGVNKIEWIESYKAGVACLSFDGTTFVASGSYYGADDDD